jgi:hypothetical protein
MTQDQPKVVRADCQYDHEACDLFVNHKQASNNTYPYILMLTEQKTYVYSGKLEALEMYNTFVSKREYMKFPVHGGPSYTTVRIIEDGKKLVVSKMEEERERREENMPWWIDEQFGRVFAPFIGWFYYTIGLDFWSKQAKVTIFIAGILTPALIGLYHFISNLTHDCNKPDCELCKSKRD